MDALVVVEAIDPGNCCDVFLNNPTYRAHPTRLIIWAREPLVPCPVFVTRRLSRDFCYLVSADLLREGTAYLQRVTRRAIVAFTDGELLLYVHPGIVRDDDAVDGELICPSGCNIQSLVCDKSPNHGFWLFDPDEPEWRDAPK